MQQEREEIRRKATDLLARLNAPLQQTESQQIESIILHQLVESIRQSEFRRIVEHHKHQMLQPAAVKQTRVDQQVLKIEAAPTEQTVQPPTEDLTLPIEQELIVEWAQQMQRLGADRLTHVAQQALMTVDDQTALTRDHKALAADQE